jgi:serine/threonine kinase 38
MNKMDLDKLLKAKKISQLTYDKVIIAKQAIERKYNLKNIKNTEINTIFSKINSLNISPMQKEQIKQDIYTQESAKYRKQREKQSIRDYKSLAIIGRGAFGEVHVCREKKTGSIVAVKKIRKDVLVLKNQVIHVRNEQLFMSKVKSPWIVELKASFQEGDFLYLIMEFLPGGDFMNLLIKKDILTETEARFYTAELILAIESIHKLDCIHRDIKPDNVLIDKNGHIKLSDFGLAKVSDKIYEINKNENTDNNDTYEPNKHQKNYSCVGTAYYVAPEVLNKKGYGQEVDWWSVGVIFFEMLMGYAPFCSKETSEVCQKVLNWKKFLRIPSKKKVSKEAEDLIFKLINNPNERLGLKGADEIKKHPFFKGVDWDNIRNTKAPFIPKLKNDYDTAYFETMEPKGPFYPPINKKFKRKDIEFFGYTFKESDFNDISIKDEFQNSIEAIKYMNRDKSNGESFDDDNDNDKPLDNNPDIKIENGGNNINNGIEIDKKVNNVNNNLSNGSEVNNNNTYDNKVLMTKKLSTSKNKNNKIKINDNNSILYNKNYNSTDKSNPNNKIASVNNINYNTIINKEISNKNISNNSTNKAKKKIKIYVNKNLNNYQNKNSPNKIIKTEPNNNNINNININIISLEPHSIHNNNTKLNIIQLPTKKIKDNIHKKIILQENDAPSNNSNSPNLKKNLTKIISNKQKYIPYRFSPLPKDFFLQNFILSKNNLKKMNTILSKSSDKGEIKKYPLKNSISQNAIKKKYIGLNSAKSIFLLNNKSRNNNINNNMNNSNSNNNNEVYYKNNCLTERNHNKNDLNLKLNLMNKNPKDKVSYIYQKKYKNI